ncbi:MAG: hypothetical protein J6J16_08430 [Lachnospiraceae bacterium]|nr:hypothetical protein [Lachnospiraceae bacterium]
MWRRLLSFFMWLLIIAGWAGCIIAGYTMREDMGNWWILATLVGILIVMLIASSMGLILENAKNHERTAKNTKRIKELAEIDNANLTALANNLAACVQILNSMNSQSANSTYTNSMYTNPYSLSQNSKAYVAATSQPETAQATDNEDTTSEDAGV